MRDDELAQQLLAFGVVEIDDSDAVFSEPIDAAQEGLRFADNNCADAELADQAAAVPARSEGGRHDRVAIRTLSTGLSKSVRLAVDRRVILLYPPVVSASEQIAFAIEQRCPDRYSALACAETGFL